MPAVSILLPAPLHGAARGVGELEADGETVGAVLASLLERHPVVARLFLAKGGVPRRGVGLFLNGHDVRALRQLDTPVAAGDRLAVVLLMAGG